MWKNLLLNYSKVNPFVIPNPPATLIEISEVESKFNLQLPKQFKDLLLECNGDRNFVFSTKDVIETNIDLRNIDESLNSILFVTGNGCGDYFGYYIVDGTIQSDQIYMWEHESDSLKLKANDLKEAIDKYYNDKL